MAKKEKTFTPPKTMGACADLLFSTRAKRLALNKEAEAFEAIEIALKAHIIDTLPKSNASGIAGKLARVAVETKKVPIVEDWAKLYSHIKKTGDFDLLGRSLSKEGVKQRLEAGKTVPGVGSTQIVTVSLSKL